MTLTEPQVSRFNQMLVVSVSVHCLILAVLVYLPKQILERKVVRPAFKVQLMELPASKAGSQPVVAAKPVPPKEEKAKPAPAEKVMKPTPVKKTPPPAVAKKTAKAKPVAPEKVRKPTPVKKTPPPPAAPKKTARAQAVVPEKSRPKPVPVEAPKKPSNNLFQELDQVAALPKNKTAPPPPMKEPDTFLEEQVRELEALKASPVAEKIKPVPVVEVPAVRSAPSAPTEAQKKFDELVTAPVRTQAAPVTAQPKKELMEDLESISKLEARTSKMPSTVPIPQMPKTSAGAAGVREIETLKQELASLQQGEIKVDMQSTRKKETAPQPAFKSQIHSLSAPDPTKVYVKATVPRSLGTGGTGPAAGSPEADVLDQYIAEIQQRVFSNWKNPVGAEHSQVQATVVLYPSGNIELPQLVQSSGSVTLDNLALRAISASEPFPPFPRELKEPNLKITLYFSYVIED